MTDNNPRVGSNRLFHLKLVARIALSVSAVACVCLLLAVALATDDKGTAYGQIIVSYRLTSEHLGPLLLISGLATACFAGFVTWLIALYSSFRIAGPLFRIARNLEMEIERGPAAPVPIRSTDLLQREWKEFSASIASLQAHYSALRQAVVETDRALGSETGQGTLMARAICSLKEFERRVRL